MPKEKPEPSADERTLELIAKVKQKKAEIAAAEKPQWKTNCVFYYSEIGGGGQSVNLHVEQRVDVLVKVAAFLYHLSFNYDEVKTLVTLEPVPKFTWNGYAYDDWMADIKTRVGKLQLAAKKAALEKLEQKLELVISPELRRKLMMEELENELK